MLNQIGSLRPASRMALARTLVATLFWRAIANLTLPKAKGPWHEQLWSAHSNKIMTVAFARIARKHWHAEFCPEAFLQSKVAQLWLDPNIIARSSVMELALISIVMVVIAAAFHWGTTRAIKFWHTYDKMLVYNGLDVYVSNHHELFLLVYHLDLKIILHRYHLIMGRIQYKCYLKITKND